MAAESGNSRVNHKYLSRSTLLRSIPADSSGGM